MAARVSSAWWKQLGSVFSRPARRRGRRSGMRPHADISAVSLECLENRTLLSAVSIADIDAARDQLLDGVSSIHSGVQPGHLAAYGDSAFSIADYPDRTDGTVIAAALHGDGRVVAVPDHQMLDMSRWASSGDTDTFYQNGVEWLAGSTDADISIVSWSQKNADWLTSQGYTDVSVTSASTLSVDLADADVFVAGWLGSHVNDSTLQTIDTYVQSGGGLFVAEYGQGYEWWWAGDISDAPGNRLLRNAGIGFGNDYESYTGLVPLERATTDISATEMFDVVANSDQYSTAEQHDAAHVAATLTFAVPTTDVLYQQLNEEFADAASNLNATPATPVSNVIDKAILTWEAQTLLATPVADVVAHHTAEALYGSIPADAQTVTQTLTLDLSAAEPLLERHSTGLYAAPGQQVTITLPQSAAGEGLVVRISGHSDNISRRDSWNRVPFGMSPTFVIDEATITVASAFGGHVYIDVPSGTALGNVEVTVSGAIAAPFFVLGEDTNADWVSSIRNNPAPYAELSSGNVILSQPSDLVRDLDNPEQLMTYWKNVVDAQDFLAGTTNERTRAERINIDVQISHGYLHAGYATQGPLVAGPELVDLAELQNSGSWGWFHELGHEQQEGPSTISGDGEVTVNLFTLYAYDAVGATSSRQTAAHRIQQAQQLLENGETYVDGGAFEKLAFYQQLQSEFGWTAFEQFYRSYKDGSVHDLNPQFGLPADNQEEIDQWLMRMSIVTGRDLSPHFDAWGYGVTQAARDAVAHLPQWSKIETLTATETVTVSEDRGSLTFDLNDNVWGLSGNGAVSFTTADESQNGTLSNNGDGTFTFAPGLNRGGLETLTFLATNAEGGQSEIEVTIDTPVPPVSSEGLVLDINFGDGTATDHAADGNDNSGTLTGGGTIVDGKITLDGTGGLVIGKSSAIDRRTVKQRTVALTFTAAEVTSRQVLFEEGGSSKGLNIYIDNGQLYIGAWDRKNGFDGTFLSTSVDAGREYSVALVLDGNSELQENALKGYLNGSLFGSGIAQQIKGHGSGTAFGFVNGKTRFHDGRSDRDLLYGLTGTLDNLMIYNRTLDDDEIRSLFAK